MAVDDPGAAFKFVGGRLCLDFINTVSGRLPNPEAGARDYCDVVETERLVSFVDLARWAAGSGSLSAAAAGRLEQAAHAAPAQAAAVLTRARALREATYRVFVSALRSWKPPAADLAVLNRELARARGHERLVAAGPGLALAWETAPAALDRVLWPVVRSAAELLISEERARVRQCGGEACGWLFLDTSRNRSRRWCDMAVCGNLAKVRRFRRRG